MIETISLSIDGSAVDGLPVEVHFQDDPYPGGHRYCLCSSNSSVLRCVKFVGRGRGMQLTRSQQEDVLRSLGCLLRTIEDRDGSQYMLNTIEEINFDGMEVELIGECSPLVRRSHGLTGPET